MPVTTEDLQSLPLLVGGKLAPSNPGPMLLNPANGQPLVYAPQGTRELLDAAVSAALGSQPAWARDEAVRRGALRAIEGVLKDNAEALAQVLCLEIGIPLKAAQLEVSMARAFLKHRAEAALPVDVIHDDARESVRVVRRPIGVVGAILPWNAPLLIACEKMATAFLTGNTVVMKPSPLAPLAVTLFARLMAPVLPAGVLNLVPGGDEVGAALVGNPLVGMISFTGSIRAGQAIMAAAGPGLKRLSLELGGNDAAIVLPDVDVDRMAPRIFMGAFYRSGQICAAVKRLYVHEAVHDKLLGALVGLAKAMVLGDPQDAATTMGPLSNRPQFERVRALLDESIGQGGTASGGGQVVAGSGFFLAPTLVTGLQADSRLVREEQFGPVLPVMPFARIEDAVRAANEGDYGLGASVWGRDTNAAAEVAAGLDAGSAWVNRHGVVLPHIPFGGFKHSGIGRSNGIPGIDSYSELKTVSVALA